MPRRFVRKFTRPMEQLRERWFMKPFGRWIFDPALWSLQRRGITGAFGAGLAICFVPLPMHLLLAGLVAIIARLNVPVLFATVMLVNPLTMVPVYYFAYRTGTTVLGIGPRDFRFELSWQWLQYGLGPMWKPFLVGCLVCAVVTGLLGWLLLELFWRYRVRKQYRERRSAPSS